MTAILLGMPLAPISAQFAELQPGTKVRVRAPAAVAGRLTGMVLARSGDSITITRSEATPIALPLAMLTSLEISRGKSRSRGAGKGALWGGGVMLVLAAIPFSDRPCEDWRQAEPDCERISATQNALNASFGGALFGAVIGAMVGSERWERATISPTVGLAQLPGGRGLTLGIRKGSVLRPSGPICAW